MIKIRFTFILLTTLLVSTLANSPSALKYQAIIAGNDGTVLANSNISLRISVLESSENGTVAYSETHTGTTNDFGLITLEIGRGTPVTNTFGSIDWTTGLYFLKVEFDPAGGSAYQLMGTSQLLSVPYALYADTTGQSINDADYVPANELISTLSLNNDTLWIHEGNQDLTVNLAEVSGSGSQDNQNIDSVLNQGADAESGRIINLGIPGLGSDIAIKAYIDTLNGLMLRVFDAAWLLDSGILTGQELYDQGRSTLELFNAGIDLDTLISYGATTQQFIEEGINAADLFADTIIIDGSTGVFTDSRDDSTYTWVAIENQLWMSENLCYVPDTGHYYSYLNNPANANTYGYLYTWYTAQAVCPGYWHLATDGEWNVMEFNLGMAPGDTASGGWRGTDQGTQLKVSGTSGFDARMGGLRAYDGNYMNIYSYGHFWTATGSDSIAWNHYFWTGETQVGRTNISKENSFSIRCIKD